MAKLLIVEDDSTFVQLLQGFLQKNGHEVAAAANVKSGLKLIAQNDYDLLLLDYRLPDGIGLDVMIKAREAGSSVPVIIMTSFNDVRTAVKAIQLGATDYITKPVNPDELLMIMNTAFEVKAAPEETQNDQPEFVKGSSRHSDKLLQHIDIVAPTDMA
ncbi:MAG TPA: response regulator, partial [Mucilaginibacter sp.]